MANPFYLPALQASGEVFLAIGLFPEFLLLGVTVVSLVLHYRQGSDLERRQIKWLALFGVALVLYSLPVLIAYPLLTGGDVMNPGYGPAAAAFYLISGLLPPLTIGVAVLRHRLWDIDVIIRRTLVYSILTVILTLIYFGTVAALQNLFTRVIGHQTPAAIVLSTLTIFICFTPLRRRIQEGIDRRFYRHKYNAEQVLTSFGAIIREEVDVDRLRNSILGVVEETMKPAHASLWLPKVDRPTGEQKP